MQKIECIITKKHNFDDEETSVKINEKITLDFEKYLDLSKETVMDPEMKIQVLRYDITVLKTYDDVDIEDRTVEGEDETFDIDDLIQINKEIEMYKMIYEEIKDKDASIAIYKRASTIVYNGY